MNISDFGDVIAVLQDMCDRRIFAKYAIGGAFAATLHDEPIATIDLDIFFVFSHVQNTSVISLSTIYEYARERGFSFDHEFINISSLSIFMAGLFSLWSPAPTIFGRRLLRTPIA